ncbi:MAG: 2-oxoacid:acceptor oxidoreductase subunit alpha [SAR324 cluster bacterium]
MTQPAINDFSISIATKNGSGSAAANTILYKSIFKMGIPCSSKNIFPSNIQGLPTWYQIRVSGEGYLARNEIIDFAVMFNDETIARDVKAVRPGGVILYDDSVPMPPGIPKDSAKWIGIPAWQLVKDHIAAPQLREKQRNLIYVGALAKLLGMPLDVLRQVLKDTFGSKPEAIESNLLCIKLGYEHVDRAALGQDAGRLQAIAGGTAGKIMTDGNTSCALGALFGGVTVVAWYPITPSTSLAEEIMARAPKFRAEPDGKLRIAVIQAEDELAAANMVLGAGFAGARTMTATSGPGLSLMQEAVGLGYFAEIPGVYVIVQRGGPATGQPTRTQQADIKLMHHGSHGDTRHVVLCPHDNATAFELTTRAFDLADRLQTPVFVASDLDIGMNMSNSTPFVYPEQPLDRGKLLDEAAVRAQAGKFRRYADVDGDAIPQRTIPGNAAPGAAYFCRGSGHDESARYSEDAAVYKGTLDRLRRKYETARKVVPPPLLMNGNGSREGLITFGSTCEPAREAVDRLAQRKRKLDHLLLRALPLSAQVEAFIAKHEVVFVAEQNRDGQMAEIMRAEYPQLAPRLRSVLVYDGLPPTAAQLMRQMD